MTLPLGETYLAESLLITSKELKYMIAIFRWEFKYFSIFSEFNL